MKHQTQNQHLQKQDHNKKDLSNEISDIPRDESESLQGGLISFLVEAVNIYGRQRLAAMRDADEEIEREMHWILEGQ